MEDIQFNKAVKSARAGNRKEAIQILSSIVKENPQHENGWLLLGYCLTDEKHKRICFQTVLKLNPGNQKAKELLSQLSPVGSKIVDKFKQTPHPDSPSVQGKAEEPSRLAATNSPKKINKWLMPVLFGVALSIILVGIPLFVISRSEKQTSFIYKLVWGRSDASQDGEGLGSDTVTPTVKITPTLFMTPTSIAPTNTPVPPMIASKLGNAENYFYKEDYANALININEVIEYNPEFAYAYYLRGMIYIEMNDNLRFFDVYLDYAQKAYDDANLAISIGPARSVYFDLRRWALAELSSWSEYYEDFLAQYPYYWEDLITTLELGIAEKGNNRLVGWMLVDMYQCNEALNFFNEFTKKQGPTALESVAINWGYAMTYNCLGNYSQALKYINQALDIQYYCDILYTKTQILYNYKRYDEALETINICIEASPMYGGHRYYLRAAIYYELGELEKALEDIETGFNYSWSKYGLRAYVYSQFLLANEDKEEALYWLQLAHATIKPNIHPDLFEKLERQIEELGGEPLYILEDVLFEPSPYIVITDQELELADTSLPPDRYDFVNYIGTGYVYLNGSRRDREFQFRPSEEYKISTVENLIFTIEMDGVEGVLNLDFKLFNLVTQQWDYIPRIMVGENEIRNPEQYIDERGFLYMVLHLNSDLTDKEFINISVQVEGQDKDGVWVVHNQ